jgi:tetratricopeptide (TPR) repeat protein
VIVAVRTKVNLTWSLVAALALSIAAHGARAEQGADPREQTARAFFAQGKYQDAIDIYAQLFAEKSHPHPNYLFNIGRCYQNMGDADKAIASFVEYMRRSPKLAGDEKKQVEGYIHEMEALKTKHSDAARAVAELTPAESAPPAPTPAGHAPQTVSATPQSGESALSIADLAAPKPVPADPVSSQLAAWRSAGEDLWRAEAHDVDDARLAKIEGMVAKANASDPRLAEYQLHLAGLYASKHFQDRLRLNALRKQVDSRGPADEDATKALDADASHTFVKAVQYYVQVSRARGFDRQDEGLYRLALLLQANNMEPRAREVLTRLARTMPESKYGRQLASSGRGAEATR